MSSKLDYYDLVKDFGCKGDGVTDDSAAVQYAFNTVPMGSVLKIPLGARILITQPLTITKGYFTIKQESHFVQSMDGATYQTGLIFKLPPGSTGITVTGQHITLRGVFAQEQGPANNCTFLNSNANVHAFDCQTYDWAIGHNLTSGSWYTKLFNCEWTNCNIGVNLGAAAYSVQFIEPKFSCPTAIKLGTGCKPISLFGGSIELFTAAGGIQMASDSQVNIYGTYWEGVDTTSIGILSNSGCRINLHGCYVYLAKIKRLINASGQSNVSITAHGNTYASLAGVNPVPVVYYLPINGNVDISGDDFQQVPAGTALYLSGVASNSLPGYRIQPPLNSDLPPVVYQGNDLVPLAHATAPATPVTNGLYLADGVNWDPLSKSYWHPYFVLRTASSWVSVS
jgi:hypothetical protein